MFSSPDLPYLSLTHLPSLFLFSIAQYFSLSKNYRLVGVKIPHTPPTLMTHAEEIRGVFLHWSAADGTVVTRRWRWMRALRRGEASSRLTEMRRRASGGGRRGVASAEGDDAMKRRTAARLDGEGCPAAAACCVRNDAGGALK
ncbi:1-(5-phosphoribosyl)-5-[(5-phosphoribosylamino) methylideneamino] imidazole-4-carboxamide isomerase [Striga asiatica]|uniref:1-(5-phosphoribosyl)-5-[(5-phosphoribosylamino) methylideneamino] imidazole-4-carboxamide isomerase n=1 Tax=Striga asiatica TaxID=4170 RepID=A0A5A7QH53_STRAF|nr:1-(5-phosphoribosyl)-5-[(5-phosphoribosylamino) methylideneamino] imidazole-4-carboxamide isomerase [Striga asiatica]